MSMRGSVLVAGMVALSATLAGCGGGASAPLVGGGQNANSSAAGGPASGTGSVGSQVVRYRGLAFEVPSEWPVYDLDRDPSRCVGFDIHAVYLGHQHPNRQCPTQV